MKVIKNKIVLDAKYKHIYNSPAQSDLMQVLAYMKLLSANKGGLIYPTENNENKDCTDYKCNKSNDCCEFYTLPIHIPQNAESYSDFESKMKESEALMKNCITNLVKNT